MFTMCLGTILNIKYCDEIHPITPKGEHYIPYIVASPMTKYYIKNIYIRKNWEFLVWDITERVTKHFTVLHYLKCICIQREQV